MQDKLKLDLEPVFGTIARGMLQQAELLPWWMIAVLGALALAVFSLKIYPSARSRRRRSW